MSGSSTPQAAPAALSSGAAFCAPRHRPLVLAAAILASALGFIDGTVVAIAMPAIRGDLGASLAQAQWVHNAYLLTLSALMLAGGAMGDRFGLARVFAAGIGLFVLASLVCAAAPDARVLIGARAVQGVGAAIMVPGSLAVIARAYPRAERGRAIGIWAAASALTTALGPAIGGLVLSLGGEAMWRWIFAINLPLGLSALGLIAAVGRADRARSETRIDWAGAVLATAGLLAIAWGLTGGSHGGGGPSGPWLLAGAGLMVAFLLVERGVAAPMVPLSLFRSRAFSIVNLMCFTLYGALNIVLFYLPMTLIAGWGLSELWASLTFAPLSVFISALSARMGRLADRHGVRRLLAGGAGVAAAGYAALALAMPWGSFVLGVLPAIGLVGIGMAMVVAPLSTAVMAAVADYQTGTAAGVNNAVTRMSGLIAVAAVGGLAASSYAAAGGIGSFGIASDLPGHAAAMTTAFQGLAWLAAGLSASGAVLAWAGLRGI